MPLFPHKMERDQPSFYEVMDSPELERTIKTEVQVSAGACYPANKFSRKQLHAFVGTKTRIVHAHRSVVCQKKKMRGTRCNLSVACATTG